MVSDREIVERLDKLIALFQLANSDPIALGRQAIISDQLNLAILEAAATKVGAGALISAARRAASGDPSERTVKRRMASLVELGALERTGAGPSTAYRATGLV